MPIALLLKQTTAQPLLKTIDRIQKVVDELKNEGTETIFIYAALEYLANDMTAEAETAVKKLNLL